MTAPHLVVINNVPARYRTASFAALEEEWSQTTGGRMTVVYQARRDPRRRPEWFFSPDEELTFAHRFLSNACLSFSKVTLYRPAAARGVIDGLSPTHLLIAGWDTPVARGALRYATRSGARAVLWVESNTSTGSRAGRALGAVKKRLARRAAAFLVPTEASRSFVRRFAPDASVAVVPNPVSWDRLPKASSTPSRRIIFVGEFSHRKGFDIFLDACRALGPTWSGEAWGKDSEGLGSGAPDNCRLHSGGAPLGEIVQLLRSDDVWAIPSRRDPAPLTYSEALALGLRIVVSPAIAYAQHARGTAGVELMEDMTGEAAAAAVLRVTAADRPSAEAGAEVTNPAWARRVVELFEVAGSRR
ncbi:glycosyltransferase [uncultured Nocardioides sp.]|uniref:glycosyltransferase n=1 Tax=uncultured Nocardioides sp. TaxID=198441 RepID=UPI002618B69B|nr:glycosyltransferase [uncultured Nocardioides sp.]